MRKIVGVDYRKKDQKWTTWGKTIGDLIND